MKTPSSAAEADASASANVLTRKLSTFLPLSGDDRMFLDRLVPGNQTIATDADLIAEGRSPRGMFLLKEGMAIRYRMMPDGGRQIMTFLIPGDFCGIHVFLLRTGDHAVRTVIPGRLAPVSRAGMVDLLAHRPHLAAALWWSVLQEEAMLRERIVSLGRRDARSRVAHLLCELLWRYRMVGLAGGEPLCLPLTQIELGDALGLTPVYVNRVLQQFRRQELIAMERRRLTLLDVGRLQEIAGFSPDYLHLDGASEETMRDIDGLGRHADSDRVAVEPDRLRR